MSGWSMFWYIVVMTAIISYFGLAVVISIGGYFDVKKMFKRLSAPKAADGAPSTDTSSGGEGGEDR